MKDRKRRRKIMEDEERLQNAVKHPKI